MHSVLTKSDSDILAVELQSGTMFNDPFCSSVRALIE